MLADHVRPTVHAYESVVGLERDAVPSVLAGPTCDSTDVLTTGALLPALEVGDLVVAPCMGAYTAVTASGFNGISPTPVVVV